MKDKKKPLDPRAKLAGKKLKKMRKAAGYTSSEDFANEHKLGRVHYWRMETGSNFTFNSLTDVLDIHKEELEDFYQDIRKNPENGQQDTKKDK